MLSEWARDYECQFKFVVSFPDDLTEIDTVIDSLGVPVPAWRIQLMPEGIDAATLASRRGWILNLCKERGFRFCQRLHIELFGNNRGT